MKSVFEPNEISHFCTVKCRQCQENYVAGKDCKLPQFQRLAFMSIKFDASDLG